MSFPTRNWRTAFYGSIAFGLVLAAIPAFLSQEEALSAATVGPVVRQRSLERRAVFFRNSYRRRVHELDEEAARSAEAASAASTGAPEKSISAACRGVTDVTGKLVSFLEELLPARDPIHPETAKNTAVINAMAARTQELRTVYCTPAAEGTASAASAPLHSGALDNRCGRLDGARRILCKTNEEIGLPYP